MDEHVYEVRIYVGDGEPPHFTFCVEHRFAQLPATETLAALKDEAIRSWRELYPDEGEPGSIAVRAIHLMAEERKASVDAPAAVHR